jgi:hypothetical protein
LIESGIQHFPSLSWAVMVGPAKMPANVVDRINRELNAALARPDVRERLSRNAFEPLTSTPDELKVFIKKPPLRKLKCLISSYHMPTTAAASSMPLVPAARFSPYCPPEWPSVRRRAETKHRKRPRAPPR